MPRRLARRRPLAPSTHASFIVWGECGPSEPGAPLQPPDPMFGLHGHEVVVTGSVTLDFDGREVVADVCETRPTLAAPSP